MTSAAAQRRWDGWPAAAREDTGWIDLTCPISPATPRLRKFEPPSIERVSSMPEHPSSVTRLTMVCHTGTHVDAPCHFIPGAPAIDEIPLECLHGPAVVVRRSAGAERMVQPGDLQACRAGAGDIVFLDTGWWEQGGGDGDHPWLSEAAAWWLVEQQVKLLATDLPTPDLPVCRREADFDWPVHRILLGHGVLIAENLTNLGPLAGRMEAMILPLPIVGADGSPARVLARTSEGQ